MKDIQIKAKLVPDMFDFAGFQIIIMAIYSYFINLKINMKKNILIFFDK